MAAALEHTVDSVIRGFHVYEKHLDCIVPLVFKICMVQLATPCVRSN